MSRENIIFFRNFLLRTLLISIVFTIFFAVMTLALWDTFAPWVSSLFHLEEGELGEAVLDFFVHIRIVLVFFMLAPALALHWMAKGK
ncbi:MAG: hypothetical protein SH819_10225 [Cytophagales bacterium]|nr:hypothetical protein [Cytophagales bacterium]